MTLQNSCLRNSHIFSVRQVKVDSLCRINTRLDCLCYTDFATLCICKNTSTQSARHRSSMTLSYIFIIMTRTQDNFALQDPVYFTCLQLLDYKKAALERTAAQCSSKYPQCQELVKPDLSKARRHFLTKEWIPTNLMTHNVFLWPRLST